MSQPRTKWIDQLQHEDADVRTAAAEALMRMGEDARPAAVPLVRAAGDSVETVSEAAIAALEELGPPEPSDVDDLTALVSASNETVAYWAITLLGRLGATAASAVSELAVALSDSTSAIVRQRAAWALGEIGPAAASARTPLLEASASDDVRLARLARRSLDRIDAD